MRENGTDRDVALNILSALNDIATAVTTINDNEYVAHITTQPVDIEGVEGYEGTFTVVANNVKAYQWQIKLNASEPWRAAAASGNKTATLSPGAVADSRLGYLYRCLVTGLDNNDIISNVVKIVKLES